MLALFFIFVGDMCPAIEVKLINLRSSLHEFIVSISKDLRLQISFIISLTCSLDVLHVIRFKYHFGEHPFHSDDIVSALDEKAPSWNLNSYWLSDPHQNFVSFGECVVQRRVSLNDHASERDLLSLVSDMDDVLVTFGPLHSVSTEENVLSDQKVLVSV